jgi:azurin
MSTASRCLSVFSLVLVLAACGPQKDATPAVVEVMIRGNDQMQYDVSSIRASPGQAVQVTMQNVGTLPKTAMAHNFVLLDGTVPAEDFIEVGKPHAATEYIAPAMRLKVLAMTRQLGPGEFQTINFKAPETPGEYPYLCTFPDHFAAGMRGVLTVQ